MKRIEYFRSVLTYFFIFLTIISSFGCMSRFTIESGRLSQIKDISRLKFVLVNADDPKPNMWLLENPDIRKETLTANPQKLPVEISTKIASVRTTNGMAEFKDYVLLYAASEKIDSFMQRDSFSLEYSELEKIVVFEIDAAKTFARISISVGFVVGTVVIVYLAACNCPFVYAENPEGPDFKGVLYSGAIYPQLERNDWLPMPGLKENNSRYRITLANEIPEVQHTNHLELLVVDHPGSVKPMIDQYGRLHGLTRPVPPEKAESLYGLDLSAVIRNPADDLVFTGDADRTPEAIRDGLVLQFRKPAGVPHASLAIRARNAPWMQQVYHQFQNEMGQYAPVVDRMYRKKNAGALHRWMREQQMPLSVWLEQPAGKWRRVGAFNMPGPTAFREDVLTLDLAGIPEGSLFNIKLETGFRFWEVDWIAMDFSEDIALKTTVLSIETAVDDNGNDVSAFLRTDDKMYYLQGSVGQKASVTFGVPDATPGLSRTCFLHGKGYYDLLHQPAPGKPSISHLRKFKKQDALPAFSRKRWFEQHSEVSR